MGSLSGKPALVTGAASGIGLAIARTLAAEGAGLFAVDRDGAGLAQLDGAGVQTRVTDLADRSAVLDAAKAAIGWAGGIDILVNAAGITGSGASLLETTDEIWDHVHAVNSTASFLLIREIGRHMVERGEGGRIVNITSSSAHRALQSKTSYGTSKAALMQLTRIAAAELGPYDINVNAIAPGLTRTPLVGRVFSEEALAREVRAGPIANLLHRVSEPEDIAATALFLCQPGSRQITGQTIHVSAGAII